MHVKARVTGPPPSEKYRQAMPKFSLFAHVIDGEEVWTAPAVKTIIGAAQHLVLYSESPIERFCSQR